MAMKKKGNRTGGKIRRMSKGGAAGGKKIRRMSKGGATGGKKIGGKMTVAQLRSAAKKMGMKVVKA
tara:strand:+ start:350 stop:547 length:198 start_codon:yes stop_codon:yes gene_type:complete